MRPTVEPSEEMTAMKRTIPMMAMAAALLMAPQLQAQDKSTSPDMHHARQHDGKGKAQKDPAARAEDTTERMTKQLGLSEEQAAKVAVINSTYAEKMKAERAQSEADREARKTRMRAMKDARDAELKNVLTPEQFEKMLAQREAQKERHQDKQKERPMRAAPTK